MQRLKFYVGNVSEFFKDKETLTPNKLSTVELEISDIFEGDYTLVESFPLRAYMEYITTDKAPDDWINKWFRLKFVAKNDNNEDVKVGTTEPIVPEVVATLVDDIRSWLGDTDLDNPAWTDKEYVQSIRFAVKQYSGDQNLTYIKEEDVVPIQTLVRIEYAHILAYDHAKYYALQAPNASLDKSQIFSHYSQVADQLENHYDRVAKRLGREGGGIDNDGIITEMPSPKIIDATRFSTYAGRTVTGIRPSKFPRRSLL